MKLSVITQIRNESKRLKEWVEFHSFFLNILLNGMINFMKEKENLDGILLMKLIKLVLIKIGYIRIFFYEKKDRSRCRMV